MFPCTLTIAGSDPSGGAGLQADLKVFHQHHVYGTTVVTLITVQNSHSVTRVSLLDPELISEQFHAVRSDLPIAAIKTGALGSRDAVIAVADCLKSVECPVVIDPVMISTHGKILLEKDAEEALITRLIPQATLITPNIAEAELLSEMKITSTEEAREACRRIVKRGAGSVLIKGGHGTGEQATDLLLTGDGFLEITSQRHHTRSTHGSGCTLSAAIAANLAHGKTLIDSVTAAKHYVSEAIRTAPDLTTGYGPLNHFARTEQSQ